MKQEEIFIYSNEQLHKLYDYMFQYLYENSKNLTPQILEGYLECPHLSSLAAVFSVAVRFIPDWYKPKRNVFFFDKYYDTVISEMLHGSSLNYFRAAYAECPDLMYNEMKERIHFKSPDADFTKNAVKTYIGVLCGMSEFLSRFADAAELYKYLDSFDTTDKRISLVHEIQRATRSTGYAREGWGFRLAANWLKDIGLQDFCKPDTHVAKFVKALGLTNHKTDEAVFRAFVDMIEQVKQTDPKASAFTADRLVYLIGSGDFYASNVWYRGSMEDFIAKAKEVLER